MTLPRWPSVKSFPRWALLSFKNELAPTISIASLEAVFTKETHYLDYVFYVLCHVYHQLYTHYLVHEKFSNSFQVLEVDFTKTMCELCYQSPRHPEAQWLNT